MRMSRKPTEIPNALKTINVKAVLRKRGIYVQQRINSEMKAAAMPLAKKIIAGKKKTTVPQVQEKRRHAQYTNAELNAYWEKQIHIVEVVEQHFENKVKQFIKKVGDGFLANLEKEHGNLKNYELGIVKDYFDDSEDDLLTEAQIDFTPLLDSVATLAGQEALKMAKVNDV